MSSDTAYALLHNRSDDGATDSPASYPLGLDLSSLVHRARHHSKWRMISFTLIAAALVLFTGLSSYFLGKYVEKQAIKSDWLSPPGRVDHTFHYRHEFGMRPGNLSERYWGLVFPRGRGFIQHPIISPVPHGLAVYHQLHCLDAIRHGYWAAIDGLEPGHKAEPGHIRHCIDYLRQSIMCNADTNLEPINKDLGGVTGFGFTRKCRDIVQIMAWADKWRTHNQTDHD
ncbi:hypothetical protein GQX73_g4494 [Xylaria multiplex]|uniref:Oxidase ustYa n=1 Tax=Xylaria multiplex TaxID=323545 RepID=A0A7C8J248_9PEZI|nr:hypothetical protein GQX73_g4494 [Xylaria multiplex]